MTKKIFAFLLALSLIFVTSSVFAANEIKDSMNKAGSSMQNMANGAGNVVKDAGAALTNGVQNVGNAIGNGVRTVGNTITGGTTSNNGSYGATRTGTTTAGMTRTDNMNGDYTATRTATDGTIMGMSPNTWTWFVLAIATLAIVGLVWYYAMQNKTEYTREND